MLYHDFIIGSSNGITLGVMAYRALLHDGLFFMCEKDEILIKFASYLTYPHYLNYSETIKRIVTILLLLALLVKTTTKAHPKLI